MSRFVLVSMTVLACVALAACGSSSKKAGGDADASLLDGAYEGVTVDEEGLSVELADGEEAVEPCIPSIHGDFEDRCDGAIRTADGRMWQKDPNVQITWAEAMKDCDELMLAGYDDWKLPSVDELRAMIVGCDKSSPGGACKVSTTCYKESTCFSDSTCWGCGTKPDCYLDAIFPEPCRAYWSSTAADAKQMNTPRAWYVTYYDGGIQVAEQSDSNEWGRCVRGP
jgi:hypothetical protein